MTTTGHAPRDTTALEDVEPGPDEDGLVRSAGLPGAPAALGWRLLAAAVLVVGWGLLVAGLTPRGPASAGEAVLSIVVSLAVGGVAGWAVRSRWAIIGAPVLFAIVVEVARIDVVGPTVDAPALGTYGLIALATGRGVHALLSLLPMALGAAVGAGIARQRRGDRPTRPRAGREVVAISSIVLLAFVAALLRPAGTDPIVDAAGEVLPDSIAELTSVSVNGHELGLMIRGHDVDNPVMLFLAGGPGGSELGAMRNHLTALEEHVTVVTWDQRGTGTSYGELDPADTLTVDSYVEDTVAVSEYLSNRFGDEQIHLLGQSWGTTLGVLAVQQRPELFEAYIGTGQMVSQVATDRLMYGDTLAWAQETGRDDLAAHLADIGPPPYDVLLHYEPVLSNVDVEPYDHSVNAEGAGGFSENLLVREYTLLDQLHVLAGFLDTFAVVYPQLQDIDFRETATSFEVPMFFVQGANEARGRAAVFDDWYSQVEAPTKDLVVLGTSGHRPLWEQPDEFVEYVAETVLPTTAGGG